MSYKVNYITLAKMDDERFGALRSGGIRTTKAQIYY